MRPRFLADIDRLFCSSRKTHPAHDEEGHARLLAPQGKELAVPRSLLRIYNYFFPYYKKSYRRKNGTWDSLCRYSDEKGHRALTLCPYDSFSANVLGGTSTPAFVAHTVSISGLFTKAMPPNSVRANFLFGSEPEKASGTCLKIYARLPAPQGKESAVPRSLFRIYNYFFPYYKKSYRPKNGTWNGLF